MQKISSLNNGQQNVADAFFEFLFSEDKEMGISGGGGVGKTFLISHLIDEVMPRYHEACELTGLKPQFDEVVMTSLTNKASEVLSVFTGREVQTIHSFMRLKVRDDYSTGESKISKRNDWTVHQDKIIFIDECSMDDSKLDALIQEGTQNCKIVYVGDHCQMAPVKEQSSPIYREGRMKWHVLTEQMRTQIPEIQALHAQLRRTVETGVFEPIKIVPGIIDHLDNDEMQEKLKSTFSQQTLDSRILCYTNKRVVAYNDYIRDLRGLPDEYTVGELLVNNAAIRLKSAMLSVEDEVEIIRLGDVESTLVVPANGDQEEVWLNYRNADLKTRSGGIFENIPLPTDRAHFAALVEFFRKRKDWGMYFELRNTYPDLRQRDAATVYKAQGSTYDTAFIDLHDISTCRNPAQVARMLYVALSRERHRIFLFGDLAPKYGGLTYG
ncbi:MAG: putative ATP-dependent DNA helicase [Prokaryotic dsDNA virus sp.]|jgi:hypothetical protein|nr:MAG: putative ATP-dependent DNA helicase [Prokaryotic dsDNA virus sp.]|tara:strand:- start:10275 stop:11591 length:1317 start_codon:yes stop_codon:yes gene_type:complete